MSLSHLILLAIIAIIVIPPEKLPEVARQVARFLGEMRRMTSGVFDDLKQDVVLTPEDMLKRQQQKEQAAQEAAARSPEAVKTAEAIAEEKKKAEDEYLKHIQSDTAVASQENKKPNE